MVLVKTVDMTSPRACPRDERVAGLALEATGVIQQLSSSSLE